MRHKNYKKIAAVIVASALFLLFLILNVVLAESTTHEINNFDELVEAARISKEKGHQSDTFILKNDIEITEKNQEQLNDSDFKYISFGTSEYPFTGTFDGKGHYISNLTYESTLDAKYDTGLFSHTGEGAVIKNLIISNADIQSDYRGGIVAGYSEGTTFENITVKNSHLFVEATNNVLTLITDGGIRGGAIVGEANNCVLYNCESNSTTINTNNTAGVAALSGKGLYLGGLIGTSISTEVEYSRVIDGSVKNYYDVAVGALGGNTLYVGGIIGQMKDGSKVIDSFSTAELEYYCGTYVSVGAGNSGHIGGIAGAMYGDKNEIQRCHFAGKTTSKQYNAVLVIPVIQNNVNISGITDIYEGGEIENTYFKSSLNPDVNMKVLGDSTSTSSYGPISNERYSNKDYWQAQNYDFYGNIKRQTEYNDKHYNKWIMDYERGIPVHGNSVSATLDFEHAGEVIISKTELVNTEVSTDTPYSFAVQGIKPSEYDITIKATENEGYKFISWYKVPNVIALSLEKDHIYFNQIFSEYSAISSEKDLNSISVEDNDLFIAYYQAQVKFFDINGKVIQTNWYDYGVDIPNIVPESKPTSDNAKLIGWTTTKSSEAGGGYSSITAPELNKLKSSTSFYEVGDSITKAMNLYPVYVDSISNINPIFEGNEHDSIDDVSQREGVGYTSVKLEDDGTVSVTAIGYGENGAFPDGYRFLGWYNEDGDRITNLASLKLDDIDLTQKHTFTAKLEYRVDYYGTTTKFYDGSDFDGNPFKEPFASIWYSYDETFQDMSKSIVLDQGDSFDAWYVGIPGLPHSSGNYDNCSAVSSTEKINKSFAVHAHVSGSSNYEIYITSDFPGAGKLSHTGSPAGVSFKVSMTEIASGYNFLFWACSRNNGNRQETTTSPENFDSGGIFYTGADYGYEAHLNANVTFYNKQSVGTTVKRRYKEPIFSSNPITYQYTWPIDKGNIDIDVQNVTNGVHTSEAFAYDLRAENMQVEGYRFIGWINKNSVTAEEWDYIYGTTGGTYSVGTDPYTSSSIDIATPYLLSSEEICTEPTEIYPVYVKYNVITKVNVYYENQSSEINIPSNPTYSIKDGTEIGTVTLTPNTDTYVIGTSGEKYVLSSMVRVYEDGKEEEIALSQDGTYNHDIIAGPTYTFMAKYEPVLIYHLNDTDKDIVLRERGEIVGTSPLPTYNIEDLSNNYIFVGWTVTEPENTGYHKIQSPDKLESSNINIIKNSTLVNDVMELWPVYVKIQIEVDSNIDDYLTNNNIGLQSVRYITRPDINKTQLNASEDDLGSYQFVGWYKNYQSLDNKGELITKKTTFTLEDNESIEDITYTAVYRKAYKVNYYNTNGEIIYTANAYQDENRTFVEEIIDDEGNSINVPIDGEAYDLIAKELKKNEIFQNWQWQKTDSTIINWEDFYNLNIEQDMNLYPIIRKIVVKDSTGIEIDTLGTNDKEPDVIVAFDKEKSYVCFNIEYNQPNITIHIEDNLYKYSSTYDTIDIENKEVSIYTSKDISEDDIITDYTDEKGDLIIKLYGEITITRSSATKEDKGDIFIFEIFDEDDNVINEILLSQDESKVIKIPYGNYKLKQKKNWAWRYTQEINEEYTISNNSYKLNIIFNEARGIIKWFDSMTYISNQYN